MGKGRARLMGMGGCGQPGQGAWPLFVCVEWCDAAQGNGFMCGMGFSLSFFFLLLYKNNLLLGMASIFLHTPGGRLA